MDSLPPRPVASALPDLHALIKKYGSYPAIPQEEWERYDAAYRRFRPPSKK